MVRRHPGDKSRRGGVRSSRGGEYWGRDPGRYTKTRTHRLERHLAKHELTRDLEYDLKLKRGNTYQIGFQDPNYTWYSGLAIYIEPDDEDHSTGEQHHKFTIPNPANDLERGEVSFPELSISLVIDNSTFFPENKSMSDQKPILASTVISAFPHRDLLDVEEPFEEETVEAYVRRIRDCCDCGNFCGPWWRLGVPVCLTRCLRRRG